MVNDYLRNENINFASWFIHTETCPGPWNLIDLYADTAINVIIGHLLET